MSKKNNNDKNPECMIVCSLSSSDEGIETSFDNVNPPEGSLNDWNSFSLEGDNDNTKPYWVIDPNNPEDVKNHLITSFCQGGWEDFNNEFVMVENNGFPPVGIQGNVEYLPSHIL